MFAAGGGGEIECGGGCFYEDMKKVFRVLGVLEILGVLEVNLLNECYE